MRQYAPIIIFALICWAGIIQAMTEITPPAASVVGLSVAAAVNGDTANVSAGLDEDGDEEIITELSNEVVSLTTTQSGRGVISDIAKLKKIGELLETVGETVIPALVEAQTQKSLRSAIASDAQIKQPIGLKLFHQVLNQQADTGFGEGNTAKPTVA